MGVPKWKTSRARTRKRRAMYLKTSIPGVAICSQCGQLTKPHCVCPHCGYYNKKQVKIIKK